VTESIYHLYLDDSGSRYPDHQVDQATLDRMDHFALGGILIESNAVDRIFEAHRALCEKWAITYPLHSVRIRGRRKNFAWLGTDEKRATEFMNDLERFVLGLPIVAIAAVVHRPGYVARYREAYGNDTWLMCKTAFCILVERSAKFAMQRRSKLEVYFESAGRREDRSIKQYGRDLKWEGMPFDKSRSEGYGALTAKDFQNIIIGEPRERTKLVPMIQVADLVLYPLARAGYDRDYRPYRAMMDAGIVIDATLDDSDRPSLGVKYSCFDFQKRQDPA
jgi:hypothetical protein